MSDFLLTRNYDDYDFAKLTSLPDTVLLWKLNVHPILTVRLSQLLNWIDWCDADEPISSFISGGTFAAGGGLSIWTGDGGLFVLVGVNTADAEYCVDDMVIMISNGAGAMK